MLARIRKLKDIKADERGHASTYSTRYFDKPVPKFEMPDEGMPANAAYQLVHDELTLDGNPAKNLASFVTTWMEPEANKLIGENINKNFIDHDEYPQTEEIHERVVNMLARLFNAPDNTNAMGTATIGSSEAIMLGLLAHKWSWKNRRKKAGKPYDKPNIIYGEDVHVCWDKFARYFDVEERIIPMENNKYTISAKDVENLVDENTICVGAILGTTFTGQIDDIEGINSLLVKLKKTKGWDIPIHVDGASGGFIAPFVYPDLKWDFRLKQVKSINVSGHKYGLVYPGLGWLIFRDEKNLPDDLVFKVNYLGGEMPTYTLNFSRGGAMVIAQYYNFLRLGKAGYTKIMQNAIDNAKYLANQLEKTGVVELLSKKQLLPIVVMKFKKDLGFTVYELTDKLRERGWIIPAYTMPKNVEEMQVMRMVIKENFSRNMTELLCQDMLKAGKFLMKKKRDERQKIRKEKHGRGNRRVC